MEDATDRDLIAQAITCDLFGEGSLEEPAEVDAPSKYSLGRCLGRGGFGVVYLARDQVLDRQVALKFLTDARPADVARFRREARYTARLDDPAIVKVYELGETEGQSWIAMQFIEGGNLADANLGHRELAAAIGRVARALTHAHAHGIVHRDIKPENILLDAKREAFLTDFGIARDLREGATLSGEGLVIGTPHLMPPEQARGESRSVDARSDIYSLGATLYTQLTGRRPFQRANLVEVLHAVIHAEPTLPRAHNASIPRALEAIVLRCMRKAPADRYPSMSSLAEDLDRFLAGQRVGGEGAAWFRKKVGAPPAPPTPERTQPDVTVGLEIAQEIAAWDTALLRVSSDITRTWPRLRAVIERLDGILDEHPDYAWARFYRGMAWLRLGELVRALEDMELSIDRVGEMATAHFELGRLYLRLGLLEQHHAHRHLSFLGSEDHLEATRGHLDQAVVAFQEAHRLKGGLAPWQLDCAQAIGHLATRDYAACVATCDAILEDDPDVEEVWKLRGDALRLAGDDPLESYREATGIRRSFHEAFLALGETLVERGDWAAARAPLDRAIRIHPDLVPALVLLARCCLEEARSQQGTEDALARALEHLARARRLEPDSYEVAVTHALVQLERGREPAHADWVDRALETLETAGSLRGCQNRVQLLIAKALLQRARHTAAAGGDPLSDLDRVLRYDEEDGGPHTPDNSAWREVLDAAARERERATSNDGPRSE